MSEKIDQELFSFSLSLNDKQQIKETSYVNCFKEADKTKRKFTFEKKRQ